jgi:outer membrane protein TolC
MSTVIACLRIGRKMVPYACLFICILLVLFGCQTPSQYRIEADDVARSIIEDKQKQVLGKTEEIALERPADILRRRLLIEQKLPYAGDASLGADSLKPISHWPEKDYPRADVSSHNTAVIEPGKSYKLSLIEALKVGAENSEEYQSKKEEIFLSALDLDLKRNDFRFAVTAQAGSSYILDKSGSGESSTTTASGGVSGLTSGGGDTVEGFEHSGSLNLSKTLYNGTKVTAALAMDLVNLLTGDGASSFGISGDASIAIPLLRGSSRDIVMEPLTQAERNVVYAIYAFERYKKVFAVDIAQNYLDVLKQLDQVNNAEENYNTLVVSARRTRSLADSGRTSEIEVDRAVQDELRARNRWIGAMGLFEDRLDSLKKLIGIPPDAIIEIDRTELDHVNAIISRIVPEAPGEMRLGHNEGGFSTNSGNTPVIPDTQQMKALGMNESSAIALGLSNRLDLRVSQGKVLDAQRAVVVTADALGAELTLFGKAQFGESRSLASVYRDDAELRTDKGIYTGLFNIDLPFERTAERNTYRNSFIALERAVRDFQKAEDEIKLSIRNSLRRMDEAHEGLAIQAMAMSVAEKRVKSSEMFFEAGRAELRDLLEAQEALLTAKNAYTAAIVDYRVAELEFQRDTGLLAIDKDGLLQEYRPEERE